MRLGASKLPVFPDASEYARAFFEEAIRHLEDARILHLAGRYPASVVSSAKAAELGLKALFTLYNAMGWWDAVQSTHTPWRAMRDHKLFLAHCEMLTQQNPRLDTRIRALEELTPARPGKLPPGSPPEIAANAEYPFLEVDRLSNGDVLVRLHRPANYLVAATSEQHYSTARDLLAAMQAVYQEMGGWGLPLPDVI